MSIQYATLREKIAADKAARSERYAQFETAWREAHEAGMAAGEACKPITMVVSNPSTGQQWHIADGACGFAWVTVHPGTSSFARWAIKTKNARKEYGAGIKLLWVSHFNQSMARKEAYAQAFAEVLRAKLGVQAYSHSRMD